MEDCWDKCPEPIDDGWSTWCSCKQVTDQTFECRWKNLAPGEVPETGGGGNDFYKCGDLRDTLAAEYAGKNVPQAPGGTWSCHTFSKANSRYIVSDQGIEWGSRHDLYGYVDSDLASGMAAVEAHFGESFHITSGYRCPVGNGMVGGKPTSAHIRGRGVDFHPLPIDSTWTWEYKQKIIEWARANVNANEGRRYPTRNHVHLGFNVEK